MTKTASKSDEMFLAGMRGERKGLHPANLDGIGMRGHQLHERHREARSVLRRAVKRGLSPAAERTALDWLAAHAYACDGCGRCTEACIGKIDIREVLKRAVDESGVVHADSGVD